MDVSNIVSALESKRVALPAMHTFTECDYTSAFYKKGKMKSLDILENDTEGVFVRFFCNMSNMKKSALDVKRAEEFVRGIYDLPGEI